jgi:hypothetical protein
LRQTTKVSKMKTKTKKMYVILETSFEYNDEIYHSPESGGGHAVICSENKEAIEKECEARNFSQFISNFGELNQYFYNPDDVFSDENVKLLEKLKIIDQGFRWKPSGEISDYKTSDLRALFQDFKNHWFSVYEVEHLETK